MTLAGLRGSKMGYNILILSYIPLTYDPSGIALFDIEEAHASIFTDRDRSVVATHRQTHAWARAITLVSMQLLPGVRYGESLKNGNKYMYKL